MIEYDRLVLLSYKMKNYLRVEKKWFTVVNLSCRKAYSRKSLYFCEYSSKWNEEKKKISISLFEAYHAGMQTKMFLFRDKVHNNVKELKWNTISKGVQATMKIWKLTRLSKYGLVNTKRQIQDFSFRCPQHRSTVMMQV